MSQLRELARPFPANQVETKPGKSRAAYVTHSVVNERLLYAVGPFDFELVHIIRGEAPAIPDRKTGEVKFPARPDAVVGVVARLTLTIDGETHRVEEAGDEENPAMQGDAANLKNAMSDALKRCAMRFGLGLHLWSQDKYFLDRALAPQEPQGQPAPKAAAPASTPDPVEAPVASSAPPIGKVRAAKLAQAITAAGTAEKDHASLVEGVVGRSVSLAELTEDEGKRVLAKANGAEAAA